MEKIAVPRKPTHASASGYKRQRSHAVRVLKLVAIATAGNRSKV
jgi:hypothetical protein